MKRLLIILLFISANALGQGHTREEILSIVSSELQMDALATPIGMSAEPEGATSATVAWNPVTYATGYQLQKALWGTTGWVTVYVGSSTSYLNTGLVASTHYKWQVKATASGYTSSAYAQADATTSAEPDGGGGSAGTTTPATFTSSLFAHYDLTDATQLTKNGSNAVSAVADKSGNGRGLTSNTYDPTFTTTGGLNGKSFVRMAAFKSLFSSALTLPQPFTVYITLTQRGYNAFVTLNAAGNLVIKNGYNTFSKMTIMGQGGASNIGMRSEGMLYTDNPSGTVRIEFAGDSSSITINREPKSPRTEAAGAGTSPLDRIYINAEGNDIDLYELVIFNRRLTHAEDSALMVDYFHPRYNIANKKYIAFVGNSITHGVGASAATAQFTTLVANHFGRPQYNYGISGATLAHTANDYNKGWIDEVYNACGLNNSGTLVSWIGYNNDRPLNTALWDHRYDSTIKYAISKGYSPDSIYIFSPIYSLTGYSGSDADMLGMRNALQTIATNNGCHFGDLWLYTKNRAGSYTMPDGTHPYDDGMLISANYAISVMRGAPLTP